MKRLYFALLTLAFLFAACSRENPPQVSDEQLLRYVFESHNQPYANPVDFETYKSQVTLQRASWDVNCDGKEEIVFSVDFSTPKVTYILVVSPQKDSLRELFFSKKFGWYGLDGRFIFQDGYLLLNYLSRGNGSNIRVSDWVQEVVRCTDEICASFSYTKYSWGFSFGPGRRDPITSVLVARAQFDDDTVTIRQYQYQAASASVSTQCYDQSGTKWHLSDQKNVETLGPTHLLQYRWDGTKFILTLEKEETPAISYERVGDWESDSIFMQTLYALHDRREEGEISEEKIQQDYLEFFDIPSIPPSLCGQTTPLALSSASAYDERGLSAEIIRTKEGCRLKVWQSPDWNKIQKIQEIKTIGIFNFACSADSTRLMWQDIETDGIKELFVLTRSGFNETVYIFRPGDTLQQIGNFTGFLREPNFRGIEWEWREGRFFLLVGKPFWKCDTCRNNLDCYKEIDQPFNAYVWDTSARQFAYTPCDIALPSAEFAICQDYYQQAFSVAQTMVAQTLTAVALSATPTSTLTATPTATPTRTPIPTSTVWRVEPVATLITTAYEPIDIFGVDDLPSYGIGRRWEASPYDSDFDTKPDYFLYTKLSKEQQNAWYQALLSFLEQRGDAPSIDTDGMAVLDTLDIDLDGDRKTETVFSYQFGQFYAVYGVAVMRDGKVVDSTPLDWNGDYVKQMRLIGIPISSHQNAVLAHLATVTGGSGIYPRIYRRLLTLQENKIRIVWDWQYFGGGRAGAAYQKFSNEKIEFKYLTGQPYADLLLSRSTEGFYLPDNPGNYQNYNVQLPGWLVFSWKEGKYRLSYYYDGKSLTPIRAADFIVHAPHINASLCDKNHASDCIRQIEYYQALEGYGLGNIGRSVEAAPYNLMWDEHSLYINLSVFPREPLKKHSTVWIALDIDLQGDFDTHVLNEDDRLLKIEIENPSHCGKDLSVQMVHPRVFSIPFKNYSQGNSCNIELVLSLEMLGLNVPEPEQPAKVWEFRNEQAEYISQFRFHQYFPQPAKVIGFAVFSEESEEESKTALERWRWMHPLPFDSHDPSTWGALILMSDR